MKCTINNINSARLNLAKMNGDNNMNIYDFKIKAQDGSEVALSDYKGNLPSPNGR